VRVNVYAEEITDNIEVVTAHVKETDTTFYGLRFSLKTHEDMLPPRHPDDDSSGVTFWVKSQQGGVRPGDEARLADLFARAATLLRATQAVEAIALSPSGSLEPMA
jgi:hypothetical protein